VKVAAAVFPFEVNLLIAGLGGRLPGPLVPNGTGALPPAAAIIEALTVPPAVILVPIGAVTELELIVQVGLEEVT